MNKNQLLEEIYGLLKELEEPQLSYICIYIKEYFEL